MSNKDLISSFYTAFSNQNSEAMNNCYHENIVFNDPAFGELKGDRARAMWSMLCKNAKDLTIEFSNVQANENTGSANWKATYTFSATGRKVINEINAKFEFKDGRIIKHTDSFNLHKWASQALGFQGWLLGKFSFFKKKLHNQTNRSLDKFLASN